MIKDIVNKTNDIYLILLIFLAKAKHEGKDFKVGNFRAHLCPLSTEQEINNEVRLYSGEFFVVVYVFIPCIVLLPDML